MLKVTTGSKRHVDTYFSHLTSFYLCFFFPVTLTNVFFWLISNIHDLWENEFNKYEGGGDLNMLSTSKNINKAEVKLSFLGYWVC